VNKLARGYERDGADALGEQRRRNPGGRALLSAEDLAALSERLKQPADDGGVWTGPKVARWMAARLGLAQVHPPRGWEALKKLGWSIQQPRPKNPKSATPDEQAAFRKSLPTRLPRKLPGTRTSWSRSCYRGVSLV
jgi:transposase